MVSVGEAKKLQIRPVSLASEEMECVPVENEIVDTGNDDEAMEVQRLHFVAVGRRRTKLEIEHHVPSGHAQHRTVVCRMHEIPWNRKT